MDLLENYSSSDDEDNASGNERSKPPPTPIVKKAESLLGQGTLSPAQFALAKMTTRPRGFVSEVLVPRRNRKGIVGGPPTVPRQENSDPDKRAPVLGEIPAHALNRRLLPQDSPVSNIPSKATETHSSSVKKLPANDKHSATPSSPLQYIDASPSPKKQEDAQAQLLQARAANKKLVLPLIEQRLLELLGDDSVSNTERQSLILMRRLPAIYKERFGIQLDPLDLGFPSLELLVESLPKISVFKLSDSQVSVDCIGLKLQLPNEPQIEEQSDDNSSTNPATEDSVDNVPPKKPPTPVSTIGVSATTGSVPSVPDKSNSKSLPKRVSRWGPKIGAANSPFVLESEADKVKPRSVLPGDGTNLLAACEVAVPDAGRFQPIAIIDRSGSEGSLDEGSVEDFSVDDFLRDLAIEYQTHNNSMES